MSAKILWFTGLSGVGKSTIVNKLNKKLKQKYKVLIIDGDKFRKKNKNNNSFNKSNILKNNYLIISEIWKIRNKYDYILVAVISPLSKSRLFAKKIFKDKYYEIYLYCKIDTLLKRDPKKLYFKAQNNLINLIGFNSKIKYERSKYKVYNINTNIKSVDICEKYIFTTILKIK